MGVPVAVGALRVDVVVISSILPDDVIGVVARDDTGSTTLHVSEEEAVVRAVASRRAEFTTARACAHEALRQLGAPVDAVPVGEKREPVWPGGVVGSITHCAGFRAAAVAWRDRIRSVGIDAEVHDVLPDGVLDVVSDAGERAVLKSLPSGVHWDRLLFSAKESVYKAWYPLARRWLGFEDAELTPSPDGTFAVRLRVDGPCVDGRELRTLAGRWAVHDGLVLTAVVLHPVEGV